MNQPMTVVLEADNLTVIRWSLVERLDEDLGTAKAFVEDLLNGDNETVALSEGQASARRLRDTLLTLDAVGWPVDAGRTGTA